MIQIVKQNPRHHTPVAPVIRVVAKAQKKKKKQPVHKLQRVKTSLPRSFIWIKHFEIDHIHKRRFAACTVYKARISDTTGPPHPSSLFVKANLTNIQWE